LGYSIADIGSVVLLAGGAGEADRLWPVDRSIVLKIAKP
jgi:mannose-1-phosphate guanylyltransferase